MTDEAMSPLRRRMIEDMTIRKLAPKTQQGYIRSVKDFAAFLGRSPDMASLTDVLGMSAACSCHRCQHAHAFALTYLAPRATRAIRGEGTNTPGGRYVNIQ